MQCLTSTGWDGESAVKRIAHNWGAQMLHMHPDLMSSTGEEPALNQGHLSNSQAALRQRTETGPRRATR